MSDVVEDFDDYSPPFEFTMIDGRMVRFKRIGMEEWVGFMKQIRAARTLQLNIDINDDIAPEDWIKRQAARAAADTEVRQTTTIHTLMDDARFDPETILAALNYCMLDIGRRERPAIPARPGKPAVPAVPAKDGKPAVEAIPAVPPIPAVEFVAAVPQVPVKPDQRSAILKRIAPIDQMTISREIVLNVTMPPLDPSKPANSVDGVGGRNGGNVPSGPNPTGSTSGAKSKSSGRDAGSAG